MLMIDPVTYTFVIIVLDWKIALSVKVIGEKPPTVLTFMTLKRAVVATVVVATVLVAKVPAGK